MTWLSFGPVAHHPGSLRVDIRPVADVVADIRNLPFADETFEGVECWHVLEHLLPWEANVAVREMARVTQPGGIVEIAVPDLKACARLVLIGNPGGVRMLYSAHPEPAQRHRYGYTAASLARLLCGHLEQVAFASNEGDEYAIHMTGIRKAA